MFDHHDLCPELYESGFLVALSCRTKGCWPLSAGPTWLRTMLSPPTNDSYRQIAMTRGGKPAE